MLVCAMETSSLLFSARWAAACADLTRSDPVMRDLVARYPRETLEPHGDLFRTLCRAVVGQQISVLAAEKIWSRVETLLGQVTCRRVGEVDAAALLACGLTARKAAYLRALADAAQEHAEAWESYARLGDEALFGALTQLHGIGPWTAHMAMIFAFGRLDILPLGDVGLQRVVSEHYGCARSAASLALQGETWRPWRTVAVWYLWRDLDPVPVAY
jgi:DNA-3-methyladenine glycosylase II